MPLRHSPQTIQGASNPSDLSIHSYRVSIIPHPTNIPETVYWTWLLVGEATHGQAAYSGGRLQPPMARPPVGVAARS
ncbi:hypothetical protein GW17_00050249 [Ensete ventricosum]|nr:hypothetical protein GW17_00050249 [Ensete ventricosum]